MKIYPNLPSIEDYEQYIGSEATERIAAKAEKLRGRKVVHINSTYYGGGVAELLNAMTVLMNNAGIETGWRVIVGSPDFFGVTKKMHNALQGAEINLSDRKDEIYESVVEQNSVRMHLEHDFVVVHDPQPLPLIHHYRKRGPWIWVCHVDLSHPNGELWRYLRPTIEKYDGAVVSLPEYRQELDTPLRFIKPAIDPFSIKNRVMTEEEIDERLDHYGIPRDLPIVAQVSRFDRWKDPQGVIKAFEKVRKEEGATLVLLGNTATDDPEGMELYTSLLDHKDDRIVLLSVEDTALVNAVQSKAAVVVQKSLREGFGLTVTEAMWKGTPVIGGNVGGIRHQIDDGVNGYLVDTVDQASDRIIKLLRDEKLRNSMGEKGKEKVRKNFLMTRYLEDYLDLFLSFRCKYTLSD
ncbi:MULTISPECIES: glycosyltransferase [Dethiosulfovibrio]|uniref:Glycosyltransferase n=2 Tax=Dethiosulfovibrio TaxID=47054 RepID=A0ABS9EJB2_9BACT|nr:MULTISPECIES: glycosyltransferase [Dethiosulfovibrio]MCF4112819.1 glycosyltransferase [Dethiosulfovibrio russensis]MCF4141283.1 glycosyltransferase [Dethiosulfovibrio marinus]MCF4144969.1 glycosyltransferase [Dethiosulfovibrio acidaminovorans]